MAEHEFLIAAMGWANWAYSKRYNAKTDSKPTEVNKTISIEEIGAPYKNITRIHLMSIYT